MARRGNLARWSRPQKPRVIAQAPKPSVKQSPLSPQAEHPFIRRVRAQVDGLLNHIDAELDKRKADGQRLNWLASALERLAELERILDGRPLPGSRRPPPLETTKPAPRPPAMPQPAVASPLPKLEASAPRKAVVDDPQPESSPDGNEPEGIDYGPID